MENRILNEVSTFFSENQDRIFSGNDVCKMINAIREKMEIPKHIQDAQKYIQECVSDMGFMGSPEYYRCKKLVDDYFRPIREEEHFNRVKKEFEQLQKERDKRISRHDQIEFDR